MKFQDRKKIRRILYSKAIALLLLVLIFLLSKSVFSLYKKNKLTRDSLRESKSELVSLQDRKGVLEREIEKLQTDRGVEAVIRDKFNVAKEGERLITIIEDEKTPTSTDNFSEKSFWDSMLFWRE